MKTLIPLLLSLCLLWACSSDDSDIPAPLPTIEWDQASGRFKIFTGEALTLVPILGNLDDNSTIVWKTDGGTILATGSSYTFIREEAGTYYIRLLVTNCYGSTEDEIRITVSEPENTEIPEVPVNDSTFSWRFPWTEISIAQGRDLKVKAYCIQNAGNARFQWTLDGQPLEGIPGEVACLFSSQQEGTHQLVLTMTNDTLQTSQIFTIHVCPSPGTYRRNRSGQSLIDKVYEYTPAPGHWVNGYIIVGEMFPPNCSHEQACDTVLAHFQRNWMVSLGGQGGYLVAGFDHSIAATDGNELLVKGNPYNYQSEPGIIWVSQDDNGDGLPNDQWFELAGSEYGTANEQLEYAITYYHPGKPNSAIVWRDADDNTDYIPYMSYWNPMPYYWQPWIPGNEHTYFGSRLESHHTYEGGLSSIPPYAWGYADNQGSDYTDVGRYSIANARTWEGQPANLEYIDFIKIQTAQNGWTPNLGEISTEVYSIRCNE